MPTFAPSTTSTIPTVANGRRSFNKRFSIRAVREWREYEDAVREKDLVRALQCLKSIQTLPVQPSSSSSPFLYSEIVGAPERDWEILDTCLNADDMRLVGSAYAFLRGRGLLKSFGKCKDIGKNFGDYFCSSLISQGRMVILSHSIQSFFCIFCSSRGDKKRDSCCFEVVYGFAR